MKLRDTEKIAADEARLKAERELSDAKKALDEAVEANCKALEEYKADAKSQTTDCALVEAKVRSAGGDLAVAEAKWIIAKDAYDATRQRRPRGKKPNMTDQKEQK